jgi:predicted DNA-binding transcriptional regulator AlpA
MHNCPLRPAPNKPHTKSQGSAQEALLSTEEAAQFLNVSPSWLAKARMRGDGPEYIQIGRAIRYTRMSLLQFVMARTHKTNNKIPIKKGERAD